MHATFPLRILMVTAVTLAVLPLAGTVAASTTTTCNGGEDDGSAWGITVPLAPSLYLSTSDGSLWEDTNGVPGIQRTARECYEVDGDFRVVSHITVYPADMRVA